MSCHRIANTAWSPAGPLTAARRLKQRPSPISPSWLARRTTFFPASPALPQVARHFPRATSPPTTRDPAAEERHGLAARRGNRRRARVIKWRNHNKV